MKRTIRLLAAPAAAALLLASCGSSDEPTASDTTAAEEAPSDEAGDESDSWPIVEDEDGNIEQNPEGAPADNEDNGNVTSAEFDGVTHELDVDALANGTIPTDGMFYLEGSTGVIAIAELGAEGPEDLERLRKGTGQDPVTYIRVDVDNRNGSSEIGMYEWLMYDEAGEEYAFSSAHAAKIEWNDATDADGDGIIDSDEMQEMYDLSGEIDYPNANPHQRNEQWLVGPAELPDTVTGIAATAEAFSDNFAPIPVK